MPCLMGLLSLRHGVCVCVCVNGGEGLQIWRVAVNTLIISCGQLTRGGPSAWGFGIGLTTPHHKKLICYKVFQSALDLD